MSRFMDNHPVLNNPAYQRATARTLATAARPLILLLDAAGLLLPLYRRIGRSFPMRDLEQDFFAGYQPDAHDILACTYAKSGTNWIMQITYQIANEGVGEYEHIHDVIPWPDGDRLNHLPLTDKTALQSSPTGKRVIKSHMAWPGVPYSPEAHYISVVRDPKDVFVSSYFFVEDVVLGPLMPSVNTWLKTFLSPDFVLGSWAAHVASYWEQRHRQNVLLLMFSDLKDDLAGNIAKITNFVGVELEQQALDRVVEKSSFAYMKSIDHKFYPGPVTPMAPARGSMMRRGQKGGSGELLSPDQQTRIDDYCRAELKQLGSDFPYDEFIETGSASF